MNTAKDTAFSHQADGSLKIINDKELLVNEQTKGDDEESLTRALNHLD